MRLINTRTLELEEFEGHNAPRYAILSHRWGKQEVLFKDIGDSSIHHEKRFTKILNCCQQAVRDGLEYVWIDTCCIDKSSSAELSEAINSMFRLYESSVVCYVYLDDVHATKDNVIIESEIQMSLWFTRGWTLQELIAPKDRQFFNSQWQHIGDMDRLQHSIIKVTSIPAGILMHRWPLRRLPIAQRMSWAAKRRTARIEDRAYSLMGIFSINMPMLYGEGENAFRRLQEEILKRSNDTSILFWQGDDLSLFASSPSAFSIRLPRSANEPPWDIWPLDSWHLLTGEGLGPNGLNSEPSTMTNIGLSASLPLFPWFFNTYLALVAVIAPHTTSALFCFIYLRRPTYGTRLFRTTWRGKSFTCMTSPQLRDGDLPHIVIENLALYVRPVIIAPEPDTIWLENDTNRSYQDDIAGSIYPLFDKSSIWGPTGTLQFSDVISRNYWDPKSPCLQPIAPYEVLAIFRVTLLSGHPGYLYISFDEEFNPGVVLADWDWPLAPFDDVVAQDLTHPLLKHVLDPYRLWGLQKESGLDLSTRTILGKRTPGSFTEGVIAELGIKVSIQACPDSRFYIGFRNIGVERRSMGEEWAPLMQALSSKGEEKDGEKMSGKGIGKRLEFVPSSTGET